MDSKTLHATEPQNSAVSVPFQADPTASSSQRRKKRSNRMQFKKGVSRKSETHKSKEKQGCSDSSKAESVVRKRRTRISDLFDNVETEASVKERAQRLLDSLEFNDPHFIKCMLLSNVAHGFWLHLPKSFCDKHLPHKDSPVVLIDEWGNEYTTSYLLERHGFSAGWRGFSISHRLLKGDVLLFRLVKPCKFKVYIVRVNNQDVINAALCLMKMSASGRGVDDSERKDKRKRKRPQYVEPFPIHDSMPLENGANRENASGLTVEEAADPSLSKRDNDFGQKHAEGSGGGSQSKAKANGKKLCLGETSFLREHSHNGVACS